jgi:hypothetical protein
MAEQMRRALKNAADTEITALSVAASFDSEKIDLTRSGRKGRVSINLWWTGTGVGTFSVLGSNDDPDGATVEASLTTIGSAATGDGSPAHFDVETEAAYLIVRYTRTSGTIELTAKINSNVRGG